MLIRVTSQSMQCYSGHNNQKNFKVSEPGMELVCYWWELFLMSLKSWVCAYLN